MVAKIEEDILGVNMANKFSAIKTSIKFINGRVIKEYRIKTISPHYKSVISKFIFEYYNSLISSGIPVPKLLEHEELRFVSIYHGKNIVELAEDNIEEYYSSNNHIFNDVLNIIKIAKDNNIYFDPHIKNFTIYDNKVWYVDIFPPYSEKYLEILLKSNPSQKEKIIENHNIFSPKMLPYHFLADFLATFDNEKVLKSLAKEMIKIGISDRLRMDIVRKIMEIDRSRKSPYNNKYDVV